MPSILIVDDEPEILEATSMIFDMNGFKVYGAASGPEALQSFKDNHPEALLIDHKLPGMSGLELLKAIRASDQKVPAFIITGLTQGVEEVEAEYQKVGITAFFRKPLEMSKVFDAVKKALDSAGGA